MTPLLVLALAFAPPADGVRQGEVLRWKTQAPRVEFLGRTVPAFDGIALLPVPVDTEPGSYPLSEKSSDGSIVHQSTISVGDAGYPEQNISVTGAMRSLQASPGEREAIDRLKSSVTPKRLWAEPFAAPARGCMNSPYGVKRLHNGKPSGRYHLGLDQRGPTGTPVRAPAAGIVRISRQFRLHGGTVGLDHGQGVTTLFIHLSKTLVKEGAAVRPGEIIGHIGATGFATGPHLHWVVNVHGVAVNPAQWAPAIRPCAPRK